MKGRRGRQAREGILRAHVISQDTFRARAGAVVRFGDLYPGQPVVRRLTAWPRAVQKSDVMDDGSEFLRIAVKTRAEGRTEAGPYRIQEARSKLLRGESEPGLQID